MSFDVEMFKRAMSQFATGVTIVTTRDGDDVHGMTANAFSSVSLDPMLVLVCIAKPLRTHEMIQKSGIFAVNILALSQREVAERFAGMVPGVEDRFEGIAYQTATTGAPVFDEALAWVDCRLWATYDGGDHTIFVGEVVDGAVLNDGTREPLLYFNRRWAHLGPVEQQGSSPWPKKTSDDETE